MCSAVSAALPRTRRHAGRLALLLGTITLPLLILDQASKLYVRSHMSLYHSVTVIPHIFEFSYTLNPGAAFSIFASAPAWFRSGFLFALASIAIVVLLVLLARRAIFDLTGVALAMILAGAAGNLIDRVVYGQVVDFLHVHYYAWEYPVFNVADSAITIGVLLIVGAAFFAPTNETG